MDATETTDGQYGIDLQCEDDWAFVGADGEPCAGFGPEFPRMLFPTRPAAWAYLAASGTRYDGWRVMVVGSYY